MGADQTHVCKDNRENATLKNVRSIDDCSPRGLSLQRKANVANNTGLPNNLKNGVEALSGYSLDNVRVHYNSSKPAAVQAYAYTQGTDIHIAPGQESCLPHEAWHVTQQMSGRVSPTTSIGGVAVNDDASLEHEADVMGARASTLQGNNYAPVSRKALPSSVRQNKMTSAIVQRESKKGDAQGVYLRDDEVCIKAFADGVYEVDDYKAGNQGHFKAKYTPGISRLDVTLPVFFGKGMNVRDAADGKTREEYFKKNIEETWSSRGSRHHFDFRPSRLRSSTQPSSGISWESVLNNTNVNVTVEKQMIPRCAFFKNTFFNVDAVHCGSSVGKENVKLRENSFHDGSSSDLTIDGVNHHYATLNPTAHEAGHMFGLGDEYRVDNSSKEDEHGNVHSYVYWGFELRDADPEGKTILRAVEKKSGKWNLKKYDFKEIPDGGTVDHDGKLYTLVKTRTPAGNDIYYFTDASGKEVDASLDGTVSTHYDMVKDFFDENYANEHAVMHNNPDGDDPTKDEERKGTSVMRDGDTVSAHLYVTFADAMVQAIQKSYPIVPSRVAPNTRDDWTIK